MDRCLQWENMERAANGGPRFSLATNLDDALETVSPARRAFGPREKRGGSHR